MICGGGISSVDIAFGAVNSRHREAREEDVGVVALRMLAQLAQLIAENSVQAKFAENPFHIPTRVGNLKKRFSVLMSP